ncbi:MAG TPA: hypothetical protein VMV83_14440 [Rectinemataceae bacterium]|nr:hypothetical protein [Rectinemataceae bacterium]
MKKSLVAGLAMLAAFALPAMAATNLDCFSCHGSTGAKYPLLGAKLSYEASGHATMGDSRYANGQGCQRCHTNEGYVQYATEFGFDTAKFDAWATPAKGPQPFIDNPSQQGCFTCHDPHTTGDFRLRTQTIDASTGKVTDQVITLYNKTEFEGGAGALCASCHQARGDVKAAVAASKGKVAARGTSHHGPEADMLAGTNGYEFAGRTYASSPHYMVVSDTCVTCHMSQPKGRYGFSPEVGGHAFTVAGEVHEAPVGNTTACLDCHSDIKTVAWQKLYLADSGTVRSDFKDDALFTVKAKADYDGNGKVEYVEQEVAGLLQKMVNKDGTGVMQKMANPFFKADGTFANSKATYTNDQLGAYANYLFVIEDKSLGVHNATYAIELLMDSIKAIDPSFNDKNRP